jgi:hypothetical protein
VDGKPSDIVSVAATVNNVAPVLENATLTPLVIVGGPARLAADFSDPGVRDAHALDIDWGDGKSDQDTLPAGAGELSAAHGYSRRGRYIVTVNLTDSDGGRTTQTFAVDVVAPLLPAVSSFQIDDGSKQRSMLRSFSAIFNQPVDLQPASIVLHREGGADYAVTATNLSHNGRTWNLGFFGPGTIGSSLPDGRYTLLIPAAAAPNGLGQPMVRNYTVSFHRLFGDADGDGAVDASDRAHFKKSLESSEFSSRYVSAFDFNSDGRIDQIDSNEFSQRYGHDVGTAIPAFAPDAVQELFGPVLEGLHESPFDFGGSGANVLV